MVLVLEFLKVTRSSSRRMTLLDAGCRFSLCEGRVTLCLQKSSSGKASLDSCDLVVFSSVLVSR